VVQEAPGQATTTGANLVGLPITFKVVGRSPPLGTCGGQLEASALCANVTAWSGRSGEWVLEPAGGPVLYRIRFNVSLGSRPVLGSTCVDAARVTSVMLLA
jgi:hypothetical protein